jgi:hypothetical protein
VEFDYTEEVVEELGLPIQAVSSGGATGPDDMRWDCSIAGLEVPVRDEQQRVPFQAGNSPVPS